MQAVVIVAVAVVLFASLAVAVFAVVFARALDAADRRDMAADDHSGHAKPRLMR